MMYSNEDILRAIDAGELVITPFSRDLVKAAGIQIADFDKTLEVFQLDVGREPTTEEGLDALIKRPASANGWAGPYIKGELPKDPWGNAYRYANPGSQGGIEILSLGADGAPGGEGEAADIRNKH